MKQEIYTNWMMFFYIYSFLGWIFETCYVSIKSKKWVNRGFLKGPFLPIYGSGAVMMLIVSRPYVDNLLITYVAGVVGATLLELVTGWMMEKIFKVRYWDYSYQRFHFKGYICLSSSIAWGFFTIAMNKVIHPFVLTYLVLIPNVVLQGIFCLVSIVLLIDSIISINEAMDMRRMILEMEEMRKEMRLMKKRGEVIIAFIDEDIHEYMKKHPGLERIDAFVREADEKLYRLALNRTAYQRMNDKLRADFMVCRNRLERLNEKAILFQQSMKQSHINRMRRNPTMASHNYKEAFEAFEHSLHPEEAAQEKQID